MERYTNEKAETGVMKKKQASARGKDTPGRRKCLSRGGIHPCSMGWRLAAIVAGTPAASAFTEISPTRHHGQWSGVSFMISG
jgi:hypothetical protein